jgi:hypothetical protein
MNFRTIFLLLALLAVCVPMQAREKPVSVLFVGNSLVYVGNLPAVFDALAGTAGTPVRSDMIVEGGATLKQRVDDGAVARALKAKHYDFVVLQERGGDLLCGFGPESCTESVAAIGELGRLARAHGATPLLLGTYQSLPQASDALLDGEAAAAKDAGMPYIAVSGRLAKGRAAVPDAAWFDADGMHPGHDLILLDAVLLYTQMFGNAPPAVGFRVDAPMYEPSAHFLSPAPVTLDLHGDDVVIGHDYDAQRVADILVVAAAS